MKRTDFNYPVRVDISINQRKFWHVLKIGILVLIFYIPFGIALNLGPDIDLALIRILILAFFLIWLPSAIFLKKKIFISAFQGFGLLSILAIAAVSLFFAQQPDWGLRKLLVFLSIFPLYFLVTGIAQEKESHKKITDILLIGAIVSSAVALAQFLSQFLMSSSVLTQIYSKSIGPVFWGRAFSDLVVQNQSWFVNIGGRTIMRAFGLFPDPHMMAFFIGLVSPLVLSRYLFDKKKDLKLFFVWIFLVAVLLLTFSRGGYLGLFFSVLVIFIYSWRFLDQKKKFLILVGVVLFLLVLLIFGRPVMSRFVSSFFADEGSSQGRLAIWQQSYKIFLSKPIFGVGLGNYPRAADPQSQYRSPITSHNLYLDIASETGIFGLIAWLFLLFGSFYQLSRSLNNNLASQKEKLMPLTIGLLGSLGYFSVHSLFETSIFNPTVLAVLMIIFSLASLSLKNAR